MKLYHVLNILQKIMEGGCMENYAISEDLAAWRGIGSMFGIAHSCRLVAFILVVPPLRLFAYMKKNVHGKFEL